MDRVGLDRHPRRRGRGAKKGSLRLWWRRRESNPPHRHCKCQSPPTEHAPPNSRDLLFPDPCFTQNPPRISNRSEKHGRGDWVRTSDLVIPNHARSQLRHTPAIAPFATSSDLVTPQGLEPWTRCLRGICSDQLSYGVEWRRVPDLNRRSSA